MTSVYTLAIIQDFCIVFLGSDSVLCLWPQKSHELNRRLPFQTGPCKIPDYYWYVCFGLLQQQAARLLVHTSEASVSWEPISLPLILLLWNAPFLTKEPAGGWSLNEAAASGNRGFSSTRPLAEAAGGCCQLVALRVALCVCGNTTTTPPESLARVRKGGWGKEPW